MKKYLATLALLGGLASGATVRQNGNTVQIKFEEPVVPQSVWENQWNPSATDADKGLDLFDITGDDQHKPKARWDDQDRLVIEFVEGTSCATEYRLSFRPGCGKYLGQAPMPKTSFTFSMGKGHLSAFDIPGLDEGACLVQPLSLFSKEDIEFSPESGVSFTYTQIIEESYVDKRGIHRTRYKDGATIPAVTSPAQLKHGLGRQGFARLAATKPDWAAISSETVLPGSVIVQPETPLPEGTRWELRVNPHPAFQKGEIDTTYNVSHDLETGIAAGYDADKTLLVNVNFAAQLTTQEMERAWREMEIAVGGAKAANSGDGKTKTLVINGKECRVSLRKIVEAQAGPIAPYRSNEADAPERGDMPVSYTPQGVAEGMVLEVEGETPMVMDFTIPEGVTSALQGRKTLKPHRHRITLNPAWPVVESAVTPYHARIDRRTACCVLPLKGEHKVRIPIANVDGLTATAYRVPGELAATSSEKLANAVQEDPRNKRIYQLALRLEQHARGVETLKGKELTELKRELAKLRATQPNPTARGIISKLQAGQDLQVAVPQGDDTNLYTAEAVLDMDDLLGGKAAPGIYLVRLKSHAFPSVRKALEDIKEPGDLLDEEGFILVQITDLNAALLDSSANVLMASRLSDGSFVQDAKVTPYVERERLSIIGRDYTVMETACEPAPLTAGFITLDEQLDHGSGCVCFLVESGDDYTVIGRGYNVWSFRKLQDAHKALLQTDRALYRPGETVHVRGILRMVTPQDASFLPQGFTTVNFRVRRPDRQILVDRQVKLDASGGIDESFTLPEGEEDVTGFYRIELRSPDSQYSATASVRAEVFRRDSFKTTGSLVVDPIAPKEFTYTIQATDYNGTPVANGKVSLDIASPLPLTSLQGEAQTVPAPDKDRPSHSGVNIHRDLRLDENGKLEVRGTFTGFLPGDSGPMHISGDIANDREEHVRLAGGSASVFAADFVPEFDAQTGRLVLKGVTVSGSSASTSEPLAREQKVRVSIHYSAVEKKTLPNGFTFATTKPAVLCEEEVTVPAGCREGVIFDAKGKWEQFQKDNPESGGQSPDIHICGTDAAGRAVERRATFYRYYGRGDRDDTLIPISGTDTCKLGKDGFLHMDVSFLREGTACFVVRCNGKACHVVQPVTVGQQEVMLPTLDSTCGEATVCAYLMHPDAAGVFTRVERHTGTVNLPNDKFALQTKIDVPKDPVLPGSTLHLTGQVTKDGKGVPATVTLFAVDEGMLSLSHFSVQKLGDFFTGEHYYTFETVETAVKPRKSGLDTAVNLRPSMIPGIWQGSGRNPYPAAGGGAHYAGLVTNGMVCGSSDDFDSDDDCVMECAVMEDCAPAPAPQARVRKSSARMKGATLAAPAAPCLAVADDGDEEGGFGDAEDSAVEPRLRTNFQPVAVWQGVLKTDAEGRFATDVTLPDTLTTYKVFAMVLGDDAGTFGNAEESFTVNQPLMLTPGTPLFMSTGDTLRLPLTITNNTDADGTWTVTISSAKEPQKVTIKAHGTATVYFDFTAVEEGESTLNWTAKGAKSSDAVQGSFPVRFPAPLLKEAHHLVLAPGQERKMADLLAPELATSSRGSVEVHMSANPLLHLVGCMDYLLEYPYGCTEQTASGLLPWLFYDRLAPLSPMLAETPADKVHEVIAKSVETLFKRQKADGGLGYWGDSRESCGWASAHAALVLTIAMEQNQGACIPKDKMERLRTYLRGYLAELRKDGKRWDATDPMTLFALGRVLGDDMALDDALGTAAKQNDESRTWGCFWHRDIGADLSLIRALRVAPEKKHDAFLQWMRARGHDYRHTTTLRSGWMLIALHEYLRLTPASTKEATVQLQDGTTLTLNQGVTILKPQAKPLSTLPTSLKAVDGEVYVIFKAKAQPNQTEYPGVVEKGLQITRIYEKKGADGVWREAKEFNTGDVVRVTLTCAKSAHELEYFVLEDYLPSCMEAINPNVPSQAAGLEWSSWSHWFDHKEFLADRVRGFCTRWGGRDLLNMTYYARVKRAGTTTAPPAQAQLMYEPQTYGLSPNAKIQSK